MTVRAIFFIAMIVSCTKVSGAAPASDAIESIIREGLKLGGTRIKNDAPVLLYFPSFTKLGDVVGASSSETSKASRQLARRVRDVPRTEAIRCARPGVGCEVVDDGIYVEIDSARRDVASLLIFATYVFTERRPSGAVATCTLPTRLVFTAIGEHWKADEVVPLRRC